VHADFNGLFAQVGQLGSDHGTLFEFDQGHGVGGVAIEAARGFVDGGVGKDFAFTAKSIQGLGLVAAVRAHVAGWEYLCIAMRTNFSDQAVSLLFETPVARNFHEGISFYSFV